MRQFADENPCCAKLPQSKIQNGMRTTELDQRLGIPLLAYRNRVLNALTPEQRSIWEEQIWQEQGEQIQSPEHQWQVAPADSAEQAKQWKETKQ
jgi:hypothetical protein